MKRVLSAKEMRELDRAAEEHGMPSSLLMENAGGALAEEALRLAEPEGRFLVICGQGNNGGDGLVAARKLAAAGRAVHVELMVIPEALEGEPARNAKALKSSGVTVGPAPPELAVGPGDVVVDALLGTGLNRAPEGKYAEAIGHISAWRAAGAKVLSADIPSGLQSDLGKPFAPCVRADATVAFAHLKLGEVLEPGASHCGQLRVADIGIPKAAASVLKEPQVHLLEESDASSRLPERRPEAHKGTFGHLLVVAGGWGKTGAAALAGLGGLRSGAGLVTVATRPEALVPVMAHAPELMGHELVAEGALGLSDLNTLLEVAEGKEALVIGPGIPRGDETARLLGALLEEISIPCVLDADALNALAGNLELLNRAKAPLLLTPHPGEMGRLLGKSSAEIQEDRIAAARSLATSHHVVVVLKGARTLVAREDGTVFVNPTGNPGMATGGCGDVLSGMCGGLLAQGLPPEDAAVVSVYAHGLAGELAVRRTGMLGLIASDLLYGLGEVWGRWGR
ncbi:MAG: NAD(P)H-hydrate dehydratase [Myxococcales bacterium]|nr:NAD(P)H-hydrate dehydratase [Myxococcales bacterium]